MFYCTISIRRNAPFERANDLPKRRKIASHFKNAFVAGKLKFVDLQAAHHTLILTVCTRGFPFSTDNERKSHLVTDWVKPLVTYYIAQFDYIIIIDFKT